MRTLSLVGWSLVRALAEKTDVHLVTQVRNRDALVRAGWREGEQFTALDTEAAAIPGEPAQHVWLERIVGVPVEGSGAYHL